MAKREVLGIIPCPCCDHERAEIKAQKCGEKLYLYCPECNAQVFARTEAQAAKMRRALAPREAPKEPNKTTVEEARAEPEKAPVPPAAAPKVEKKPAKSSPFDLLLGR